jgi:hypothetical protein
MPVNSSFPRSRSVGKRLLSPAWPYVLVPCIALDALTWWGVGVVILLQVSGGMLYGIARAEIVAYFSRRAA